MARNDIAIQSAGKGSLVTESGTPIVYPSEYPEGATRYFVIHPDKAIAIADALSKRVSGWYTSEVTAANNGKLPIHIYEIEMKGKPLALLCSGDKKFFFGFMESGIAPDLIMLDINMRAPDQTQSSILFTGNRHRLEGAAKLLYPRQRWADQKVGGIEVASTEVGKNLIDLAQQAVESLAHRLHK